MIKKRKGFNRNIQQGLNVIQIKLGKTQRRNIVKKSTIICENSSSKGVLDDTDIDFLRIRGFRVQPISFPGGSSYQVSLPE